MEDIEKTNHVVLLIDMYGELLTDKQREYLEEYYENDLSLSEIAEIYQVSRNAVYDQMRRAIKTMEEYEEKLGLLEKHNQRLALIEKIEADEAVDHSSLNTYLERLKEL